MRGNLSTAAVLVWLGFTLPAPARADDAHLTRWGTSLRGGSAVGFESFGDDTLSALGGEIALGHKVGPFEVEAEYDHLTLLHYSKGTNLRRGRFRRLGVNGRLFWGRIGRHFEPDSLLLLFVEAGVGLQRGAYATGDAFSRQDLSAGAGWILDHRVKDSGGGFPFNYIGWHFGWRLTAARQARYSPTFFATCRSEGGGCPEMELGPGYDVGLTVSSSLSFSW